MDGWPLESMSPVWHCVECQHTTCRWASQPQKAWTPLPTSQANTLKLWEMKQLASGKLMASSRRSRNHFPTTTWAESTTVSYLVHSISISTACAASLLASPVVIRVWFWETGCHHSWWEPSRGVPQQLKYSLDSSLWSCPWLRLDFSSPLPSFQPLGLSLCACAHQSYSSAWKDLPPDVYVNSSFCSCRYQISCISSSNLTVLQALSVTSPSSLSLHFSSVSESPCLLSQPPLDYTFHWGGNLILASAVYIRHAYLLKVCDYWIGEPVTHRTEPRWLKLQSWSSRCITVMTSLTLMSRKHYCPQWLLSHSDLYFHLNMLF